MRRVGVLFAFIAGLAGCGHAGVSAIVPGLMPPGAQAREKITHVVVIVQENRTFDDIFGGFAGGPSPYPSADASIPPQIAATMHPGDFHVHPPYTGHDKFRCLQAHQFQIKTWTDLQSGPWPADCPTAPPPNNPYANFASDPNALTYIPQSFRTAYWTIAQNYELGDSFFAVASTNSFPGHQFVVSAQSLNDYNEEIGDQPQPPAQSNCWNPPSSVDTPVLNKVSGYLDWQIENASGACWHGATFADRLDAAVPAVTWDHYITNPTSGVFDGFINFARYATLTQTWPRSVSDLQPRLAAGQLKQFTWVKPPCIWLSDHPGFNSFGGQNWVANVVNWIGSNPALWKNTVIFVVWDDWGGFYDHVTPPATRRDGLGPGMRQPFLVISGYDKTPGGVVHTTADYGSVLKFAEELYGVQPVNEIDGNAAELTDFFDFTRASPAPFTPIPTSSPDPAADCAAHPDDPSTLVDQ